MAEKDDASKTDGSEEEEQITVRPNKFTVAFLDAEHGEESGSENDEDPVKMENVESTSAGRGMAKSGKKKRRKKKETTKSNGREGSEADLDEIVRQLNTTITVENDKKQTPTASESTTLETILKSLDPDAELRRLLGRTFGAEQQRRGKQQQRRQQQAWGRLAKSRADWPPPRQIGFHMVVENDAIDGVRLFRFQHNEMYQNQQQLFWLYQRQMDHEGILNDVLTQNPYHSDSLLLLSEMLNVQEDFQRARDSIERGIFACEFAFHSSFQPLSPFHRLDYGWRENRAFFLLLHRHMLHQLQRRCFQTALQFGKMIFGKDPDGDPLGLLLIIDVLALKGCSPDFLLDFYEHYRKKRCLDMLPNFLFSLPLAHLALAEREQNAKIKEDREKEAEKCLEEAFVRFPTVLFQLLERFQLQPNAEIERNYYLNALAFYREPKGARLLVHIYVHHSAEELWRPRLGWLEQTTQRVLKRMQNRHAELDEWAQRRKGSFVGLPQNIVRHCILHAIRPNDAELTQLMDEFTSADSVTDPCPPKETKQDYAPADLDQLIQMHGIGGGQSAEEATGGMFGTFLRTLLPEQEQDRLDAFVQAVRQRIGLSGGNSSVQADNLLINLDGNSGERGDANPQNDENNNDGH